MKRVITICLIVLTSSFTITAQTTGNGVVAQINSPYTFTPTTVDSTTTITIQFNNTVNSGQDVWFTGLSAPFSVSIDTITIAGNDSATIDVSFTPTSLGVFTDTLDFDGSIYVQNGELVLNGEGVQVNIATSTDTVDFGSLPLGSATSQTVTIYNNGTGTMNVSSITCNNPAVSFSQSTMQISQGGSSTITLTYTPINSGYLNATISIASNDPNTPVYDITAIGAAVSEVSGIACGTWYAANSPYILTDNIVVPDTCTLIIEPGVEVLLQDNIFRINGTLQAEGTLTDSIKFNGGTFFVDSANLNNMRYWSVIGEYYITYNVFTEDLNYPTNMYGYSCTSCKGGWGN